jgi:hypothetical protein
MRPKNAIKRKEPMIREEIGLVIKEFKLRECVYKFIDSLIGTVFFFSSHKYEEAFRCVLMEEMMGIFVNLLSREEELSRKINQEKINSNTAHLKLVEEQENE